MEVRVSTRYSLALLLFIFVETINCQELLRYLSHWRQPSPETAKLLDIAARLCPSSLELTEDVECQTDCEYILKRLNQDYHFENDVIENLRKSFNIPKSCFDFSRNYSMYDGKNISPVYYKECSDVIGESYDGLVMTFTSGTGNDIVDIDACHLSDNVLRASDRSVRFSDSTAVLSNITGNRPRVSFPQFISDVNKGIATFEKFNKILQSSGVKTLVDMAASISSFLGPVGAAFQFLSFLFPTENAEHKELLQRFDLLEVRIREVSDKLDTLQNHVTTELFQQDLWENVRKLENLEHDIRRFVQSPSNATTMFLTERCKANKASEVVQYFTYIIKRYSWSDVSKFHDWDRETFQKKFGKPALGYMMRGMAAQVKCMGALGHSKEEIQAYADDLQQMVRSVGEMIQYVYDVHIPDNALSQQIESDVTTLLRLNSGKDNEYTAKQVYQTISTKYNFFTWSVNVYNDVAGFDNHGMMTSCFKCVGRRWSGSYYVYRQYGKNINIMYSNNPKPGVNPQRMRDIVWNGLRDTRPKLNAIYNLDKRIRNILIVGWGHGLRSLYVPNYFLWEGLSPKYILVVSY